MALTGALGAALIATTGPAAAAENCGAYAGGDVIVKGGVPCRKAKAIVKEFIKVRKSRIQGFNCKGSSTKVNCKSGSKTVKWQKG
jgi:hypothetical protein